jgi:hypothetical protein
MYFADRETWRRYVASCDLKVASSFATAQLMVKGAFWAVTGEVVLLGGRICDDITSFLSWKAIVREKGLFLSILNNYSISNISTYNADPSGRTV